MEAARRHGDREQGVTTRSHITISVGVPMVRPAMEMPQKCLGAGTADPGLAAT